MCDGGNSAATLPREQFYSAEKDNVYCFERDNGDRVFKREGELDSFSSNLHCRVVHELHFGLFGLTW